MTAMIAAIGNAILSERNCTSCKMLDEAGGRELISGLEIRIVVEEEDRGPGC